jgi:hypothetical protein
MIDRYYDEMDPHTFECARIDYVHNHARLLKHIVSTRPASKNDDLQILAEALTHCCATNQIRRKHGNDVEEGRCYIIESVPLRRCSDDQSLPGLLRQSAPVPLTEGFMHKLASAGLHGWPATQHRFMC